MFEFLKNKKRIDGASHPELDRWVEFFTRDKHAAAYEFWYHLRRANIGVAMGLGTDVAKEVGSMIVAEDNFASILAGVEEGRFAYDNVRKVIYLLISTGAAEVLMFIAAILVGLPIPLLAVQLLWLNLVTNGIQDVALAFEGGEPGAMKSRWPSGCRAAAGGRRPCCSCPWPSDLWSAA